jgi:hypothetical protein
MQFLTPTTDITRMTKSFDFTVKDLAKILLDCLASQKRIESNTVRLRSLSNSFNRNIYFYFQGKQMTFDQLTALDDTLKATSKYFEQLNDDGVCVPRELEIANYAAQQIVETALDQHQD